MDKFKNIAFLLSTLIVITFSVQAQTTANQTSNQPTVSTTNPTTTLAPTTPTSSITAVPVIDANGYILLDANSGLILAAKNPDVRMQPASLTKLITMYVISGAIQAGRIHLTDQVPISKEAWKTGGSRMFVQAGSQVPVQDLINGIVVDSGNDAAVAMAEYVGGSEENFVNMMNQTAAQLGMKNSHFMDVNGLPASDHYTTPQDLSLLVRALIMNFPQDYSWYSQKWFTFNNIKQANRNRLLWQDPTVDGLKTGHTDAAGYCLIASANRNGMRLISIVMGAPSSAERVKDTEALLNWGFHNYSTHQLFVAGQPLAAPRVWFGENKDVPLGLARGLFVTIPNGQYQNLKALLTLNAAPLMAPITKGQAFGQVNITLKNQPYLTQPVVALENNPRGNLVNRIKDHVLWLFHDEA